MIGIESSALDPLQLVGKEINNITIVELLGCGAMGAVFIGYQKTLKRKVAVKFFPKRSNVEGNYSIRFREEAEIVAGLTHPNIVQVFDMGETEDYLYIIMQLIVGEDLRAMIHRYQLHPVPARRLIEVKKVLEIILPILDALSYAHEEGVIHQDIKPGNILIEKRSGRAYLADFGIAKSALNNEDESSVIMGTPLYIAPEQVQEKPIDHRCDIYSAGVVLYEAIAGKLPVQKTTVEGLLNIKINNPETLFTETPSSFCAVIDKSLEKIILKAIEPDKEKRFKNCREFYNELFNYYNQRYRTE